MISDRDVQECLSAIPGWGDAKSTQLEGGLTNSVYKLDRNGSSAILKVDSELRTNPFRSRQFEADMQRCASEAGLAARVLYASDRVLLTEYLEGSVWSPEDLASDDNLRTVARALRQLHAIPTSGDLFDAKSAAEVYAAEIDGGSRELTAHCLSIIESSRAQQLAFCHNDLVAGNIVSTPDLKFLDWEYACDNDALFDLATVIEHHGLSDDQAILLLREYDRGQVAGRIEHLERQRAVYLALLWLWKTARADQNPDELEEIRSRLATRYCEVRATSGRPS